MEVGRVRVILVVAEGRHGHAQNEDRERGTGLHRSILTYDAINKYMIDVD